MNYNYDKSIFKNSYSACSNEFIFSFDLDLHRLVAFKNMLSYIFYSKKIWNYSISSKNQYSRMIIDDLSQVNIYQPLQLKFNDIKDFCLHLCIDCTNSNSLSVQTFFTKEKQYIENEDEINLISDYYINCIKNVCNQIIAANKIENYFFECFQIKTGDLYGYYSFDRIEIDGGIKNDLKRVPRIIKTKMKYYKFIIEDINYFIPENNTLFIDRRILLVLLQTFTRCHFETRITDGVFFGTTNDSKYIFDKNNKGKLLNIDRNNILKQNYDGIPVDVNQLINKFYNLSFEEQNLFLSVCEAYIDGIRDYSTKSLSLFIYSLEGLANYEYNDSITKSRKIKKLLKNLFIKKICSPSLIDHAYKLRNLYSHQAATNNRLKFDIWNFHEVDKDLIYNMEAITYSSIVKWLERK